ncbi:hypothetical protein EJ110_NYTH23115, partial [Nymphaea thermarum]
DRNVFLRIAGLFISSYLWCTILWSVVDRKEGIKSLHLLSIPYKRYRFDHNRSERGSFSSPCQISGPVKILKLWFCSCN